jgi:excinuclease ABC subunit C
MTSIPTITSASLAKLPQKCGVYLMYNCDSQIIYIGKAKNLRSRVRSYFNKSKDSRYSIDYLVKQIASIETIITETERQALILESDLIKRYQPYYNIRLKDDKAHLVAKVDTTKQWPRVELVRQIKDDGSIYIGPFAFSYEIKAMIEVIKRVVPLRTCSDNMLRNRVRPCIEYQIKRCLAPCCLDVDPTVYSNYVTSALSILRGKNSEVIETLKKNIERLIEELRFEEAAEVRDRLNVLIKSRKEEFTKHYSSQSQDVIGLYREGTQAAVSLLLVRKGRLFAAKNFEFENSIMPDEEIISAVISQYYQHPMIPPEIIIVPIQLDDRIAREQYYSDISGGKVKIVTPQRGPKSRLLALANTNAKETYNAKFKTDQKNNVALSELKTNLELVQTPRVIECVDISHFQGQDTVASVVCFKDGVPDQTSYRRFILSSQGKPDDFGSMLEVLRRHLSRAAQENSLCDLMVIDGGQGQLSQALKVKKELSLDFPIMTALAKKRVRASESGNFSKRMSADVIKKPERVFVEGENRAIVLEPGSPSLNLLEQIRNEAHRFAVTFHRQRRSKRIFQSGLDKIPGIGSIRKKRLLRAFDSISDMRAATPEQMAKRAEIPLTLAKRIIYILGKTE